MPALKLFFCCFLFTEIRLLLLADAARFQTRFKDPLFVSSVVVDGVEIRTGEGKSKVDVISSSPGNRPVNLTIPSRDLSITTAKSSPPTSIVDSHSPHVKKKQHKSPKEGTLTHTPPAVIIPPQTETTISQLPPIVKQPPPKEATVPPTPAVVIQSTLKEPEVPQIPPVVKESPQKEKTLPQTPSVTTQPPHKEITPPELPVTKQAPATTLSQLPPFAGNKQSPNSPMAKNDIESPPKNIVPNAPQKQIDSASKKIENAQKLQKPEIPFEITPPELPVTKQAPTATLSQLPPFAGNKHSPNSPIAKNDIESPPKNIVSNAPQKQIDSAPKKVENTQKLQKPEVPFEITPPVAASLSEDPGTISSAENIAPSNDSRIVSGKENVNNNDLRIAPGKENVNNNDLGIVSDRENVNNNDLRIATGKENVNNNVSGREYVNNASKSNVSKSGNRTPVRKPSQKSQYGNTSKNENRDVKVTLHSSTTPNKSHLGSVQDKMTSMQDKMTSVQDKMMIMHVKNNTKIKVHHDLNEGGFMKFEKKVDKGGNINSDWDVKL